MAVNVIWEQRDGDHSSARVSLKAGELSYEVLNGVGAWAWQPGMPEDAVRQVGRVIDRMQSSLATRVIAMDSARDRLLTVASKSLERGSSDLGQAIEAVEAEMARRHASETAANKRAAVAEAALVAARADIREALAKLGTPSARVMNPEAELVKTANELHAILERLKEEAQSARTDYERRMGSREDEASLRASMSRLGQYTGKPLLRAANDVAVACEGFVQADVERGNVDQKHADDLARAKSTAQVAIDLGMTPENVQRVREAVSRIFCGPPVAKGTPMLLHAAIAMEQAASIAKEAKTNGEAPSASPTHYTIVLPPGCSLSVQQLFAPNA